MPSSSPPKRHTYVFEGAAYDHWVFGAFVGRDITWFRSYVSGFRVVGTRRVHGLRALVVKILVPGIFASHLAAIWQENGVLYASTKHLSADPLATQEAELLAVARGFREGLSSASHD